MKNKDIQISNDFRMSEFVVSDEYPQIAGEIELSRFEEAFITILVHTILQPARDYAERAIKILSCKRNDQLNDLVDGSNTSDHLQALAADWVVLNKDRTAVDSIRTRGAYKYIIDNMPYAFGQHIFYLEKDFSACFCHTSLPTLKHQGEVWTFMPGLKEYRRFYRTQRKA